MIYSVYLKKIGKEDSNLPKFFCSCRIDGRAVVQLELKRGGRKSLKFDTIISSNFK